MKSNTRFKDNKKGIECLNCNQPISNKDNFCSNCGQVNDLKSLSIKQYLTEFLSGFFSFDTRTINTIIPLLFKPGKVTNEYVHGSRMRYVNPFQLYLHTSIIFFLITGVFSSIDSYNDIANNYKLDKVTSSKKKDSILNIAKTELAKVSEDLNKTKEKLNHKGLYFNTDYNKDSTKNFLNIDFGDKKKPKNKKTQEEINKLIIKNSDSLFFSKSFNTTVRDSLLTIQQKDKIIENLILNRVSNLYATLISKKEFKENLIEDFQNFKTIYIDNLEKKLKSNKINYEISDKAKMHSEDKYLVDALGDSFYNKIVRFKNCKTKNVGKALDSLGYKRTTMNIFWFKKAKEIKALQHDKDAQTAYLSDALSKIAIVLFFMLPIFALFMKLFYIRRKINYTEHLIFIFHTQTVFFLMLLVTIIFNRIFKTDIATPISILLFLFYLFIAMRKFYKQSRRKTFLKFILLNSTYLFLSIIGIIVVGFLAFIT